MAHCSLPKRAQINFGWFLLAEVRNSNKSPQRITETRNIIFYTKFSKKKNANAIQRLNKIVICILLYWP